MKKLTKADQRDLVQEYEERKLHIASGWVCRWFGFHYLHTGRFFLWLLFVITLFFGVGIIRWILQAFLLEQNIRQYNARLKKKLYEDM